MARYIDANHLYYRVKTETNPYGKPTIDYKSGVKVLDMIENQPTADVVEVETIKSWLYSIAINNVNNNGDFSDACEEIISRLDGLRRFAKERSSNE